MPKPLLPPFAAMRAFDAVGRSGGIRKGAQVLGVSHAIVSRHLSALESMLGVLLLNRQTGQLTDTGRNYHSRIAAAIHELGAATEAARREGGTSLTIWCSAGFALHWLTSRLSAFAATRRAPFVDLHSTESEPDFGRNEADADIRYLHGGTALHSGRDVRAVELARPLIFPVATPEFITRHDKHLLTLRDLIDLPRIEETSSAEWISWYEAQGIEINPLPTPAARYGQAHLTMAAVLAGQGVALSNRFLASEHLAAGRLVRVEPRGEPLRDVALGAYVFRTGRGSWSDSALGRFRTWLQKAIAREAM